jgi:hypothetical protein
MKLLKLNLLSLFILILVPIFGAEGEEAQTDEGDDQDLEKSLDEQLDLLQKSKSNEDEDVKEMMKNPEKRKKAMKYMKEYEDEGDDEGDDDEDKDKMKGKKKKDKMKKSIDLDDAIEEHEDVIDANPILKSFVSVLEKLGNSFDILKSEVQDLKEVSEKNEVISKSMKDAIVTEGEMIKSLKSEIENVSAAPKKVKGVFNANTLLKKSFETEEENQTPTLNNGVVKAFLIKSAQEKKVTFNEFAKWEQGGYNYNALSPQTLQLIKSEFQK